jgi:hypothetical protein
MCVAADYLVVGISCAQTRDYDADYNDYNASPAAYRDVAERKEEYKDYSSQPLDNCDVHTSFARTDTGYDGRIVRYNSCYEVETSSAPAESYNGSYLHPSGYDDVGTSFAHVKGDNGYNSDAVPLETKVFIVGNTSPPVQ